MRASHRGARDGVVPGMEYVAPEVLEAWIDRKRRIMAAQPIETRQEYIVLRQRLLKALYDGGARFVRLRESAPCRGADSRGLARLRGRTGGRTP